MAKKVQRPLPSEKQIHEFLKLHLSKDFPNLGRKGCPSDDALRLLAAHPREIHPSVIRHIGRCSPCFYRYGQILRKRRAKSGPNRAKRRL